MGPSQGGSSLGGPELLLEVAELTRGFRDDSDCLSGRTLGGFQVSAPSPGKERRRWAARAEEEEEGRSGGGRSRDEEGEDGVRRGRRRGDGRRRRKKGKRK